MNIQHTQGQTETTITEKGRIQRSKFKTGNGNKTCSEENGYIYFIHITILYIFIMVTTHQRFKTEVYNIKEEGPEGKSTKHN